jgi:UDP-N-acetylmuramate-alanine ligase
VEQLEGAWMEVVDSLRSGDLLLLIGAGNIDQLRCKISQIEQN